jgi:hypothetical protein
MKSMVRKCSKNAASRRRSKIIFKACGFLLLPIPYYASLRPVSDRFLARKYLKKKYLKQYFKSDRVFHSPVENPVENFQFWVGKRSSGCIYNTFHRVTQRIA